jgi:hypothetical protein
MFQGYCAGIINILTCRLYGCTVLLESCFRLWEGSVCSVSAYYSDSSKSFSGITDALQLDPSVLLFDRKIWSQIIVVITLLLIWSEMYILLHNWRQIMPSFWPASNGIRTPFLFGVRFHHKVMFSWIMFTFSIGEFHPQKKEVNWNILIPPTCLVV